MLLRSLIEILSLAGIISTWTQLNNIDIKSMTAWVNSPEFKYKAFQLCLMWAGFIFLDIFDLVYCYCFAIATALCDNFLLLLNHNLFQPGIFDNKQKHWWSKSKVWTPPIRKSCKIRTGISSFCFHLNFFLNGIWLGYILHKDFLLICVRVWALVSQRINFSLFE